MSDQNISSNAPISGTQFLTLSLFLLLLAFFIAMTAGAEFDKNKTDPVIDSLEKVFPVHELRGKNNPAPSPDERTSLAGTAYDSANGLFKSDLFPFPAEVTSGKGALIIKINSDQFLRFLNNDADIVTPLQRQRFFAGLSALSNQRIITVMLPTSTAMLPRETVRLAERIKNGMVQNGLPAQKIIVGTEIRRSQQLHLVFREDRL